MPAAPAAILPTVAVAWTSAQEAEVERLLRAHPAATGRCASLARDLLPIARGRDADAHGLLIRPKPGQGRYVVPRAGTHRWFHHVTVGVEAHCVDALTGKAGTERGQYLPRHWRHPDALCVERSDLEDPCL